MKKKLLSVIFSALLIGSFLAGSWYGRKGDDQKSTDTERKILYYVDPMNPAHTSDKPGRAPCGMDMEPVYADESLGKNLSTLPPGTVRITPEKQQLIGVRVAVVEKKPLNQTIRLLGRVVPDENRTYLINATVDGWITEVLPKTTGTFVKKNETLATFYSPEFLTASQALLFALSAKDRVQTTGKETSAQKGQITQFNINLQQYKDSLRNLGMGELQIKEMIRNRKFIENVDITAPADGFVIKLNAYYGQRFLKGEELYKIADLSRVWILADLYENEAHFIKPGATVKVTLPYQKKTFQAMVSNVLPLFDTVSRTLKVRVETNNPDFVLLPDMFVDVEFPISLPATITIPVDAVIDSGLRKTVFIDRGNGFFEPRSIETGWRRSDQVEIVKGLMPGERIVISGTFLVDSESRMKRAAAGLFGPPVQDPVCGMIIDEDKAKASGLEKEYLGHSYYFCCASCKQQFDKNPAQFVQKAILNQKEQQPPSSTASHDSREAMHD